MNLNRIARKLFSSYDYFKTRSKISYSQYGEDLIISNLLLNYLKRTSIKYLDIGANLAKAGSNTYLFYTLGFNGVCIEPDPDLAAAFSKQRKRDKVLPVGIGIGKEDSKTSFYRFPGHYNGWNTFLLEEAESRRKESGINFTTLTNISLVNINDILKEYFPSGVDLISLDVEGLDFDILKSIDFEKYRPDIFCIETIEVNYPIIDEHKTEIFDFMKSKGYKVYASTFVNTIFVKSDII